MPDDDGDAALLQRLQLLTRQAQGEDTSYAGKVQGWLHHSSSSGSHGCAGGGSSGGSDDTATTRPPEAAIGGGGSDRPLEEAPPLDPRRAQMFTASRFGDMAGVSPYGLPRSLWSCATFAPSASHQ
jgi:hypothetical protein